MRFRLRQDRGRVKAAGAEVRRLRHRSVGGRDDDRAAPGGGFRGGLRGGPAHGSTPSTGGWRARRARRAVCPRPRRRERRAFYGSTADEPEQHFLGWADEVEADELFAPGRAWGLAVRATRVG